jgi:hypothetical protein
MNRLEYERWQYDSDTGLYFRDGFGIGLSWREVEDAIDAYPPPPL